MFMCIIVIVSRGMCAGLVMALSSCLIVSGGLFSPLLGVLALLDARPRGHHGKKNPWSVGRMARHRM